MALVSLRQLLDHAAENGYGDPVALFTPDLRKAASSTSEISKLDAD